MHRYAMAAYRGPRHIIERVNDRFRDGCPFDPIGMPADEAFPDAPQVQAAMTRCYQTGELVTYREPGVLLVIDPVREDGRVVGVATCWFATDEAPLSSRRVGAA